MHPGGSQRDVAVELEDVKGVGPSAARKLRAAGVESVQDLVDLDLRATDVEGLSSDNVARLRKQAEHLLEASETGELTLVEGLGPSAATKLRAIGVETVEDLAELDLRSADVPGLSTENIQKLKWNARYLRPRSDR